MADALTDVLAAAGEGTSREKLDRLMYEVLPQLEPADEQAARQLSKLTTLLPWATKALPDEPAELDRLFAIAGQVFLMLRSDGAPPIELPQALVQVLGRTEPGQENGSPDHDSEP